MDDEVRRRRLPVRDSVVRTRDVVAAVTAASGLSQPPEGFGAYNQAVMFASIAWLGQRTVGGENRTVCRHFGAI